MRKTSRCRVLHLEGDAEPHGPSRAAAQKPLCTPTPTRAPRQWRRKKLSFQQKIKQASKPRLAGFHAAVGPGGQGAGRLDPLLAQVPAGNMESTGGCTAGGGGGEMVSSPANETSGGPKSQMGTLRLPSGCLAPRLTIWSTRGRGSPTLGKCGFQQERGRATQAAAGAGPSRGSGSQSVVLTLPLRSS